MTKEKFAGVFFPLALLILAGHAFATGDWLFGAFALIGVSLFVPSRRPKANSDDPGE